MKTDFLILIFVIFILFSCEKQKDKRPFGTLIEVPNEVASIKEAINIAQYYDTVLLHPMEYHENEIVINKPIYITSTFYTTKDSNIIKQTVINADQVHRIFFILDVPDTIRINGFTIKGGGVYYSTQPESEKDTEGGGIYCKKSNLILSNMVIADNFVVVPLSSGYGGALFIDSSFVKLDNTIITNNIALKQGGGIYCAHSTIVCLNSKFEKNSCQMGYSDEYFSSSIISMKNTQFQDIKDKEYFGVPFMIDIRYCSGYMDAVMANIPVKFYKSQISITNCVLDSI